MSETLSVSGGVVASPVEGGVDSTIPKPSEDFVEVDSLASSPASPASVNHEVNHGATPMPLLPQLLFSSQRPLPSAASVSSSANEVKSVTTSLSSSYLSLPPPPGYRADPGAPPGCFEHSLNILGGRYLLLDQLEGSHLQRCIDVTTKQEFVCKVRNPSLKATTVLPSPDQDSWPWNHVT